MFDLRISGISGRRRVAASECNFCAQTRKSRFQTQTDLIQIVVVLVTGSVQQVVDHFRTHFDFVRRLLEGANFTNDVSNLIESRRIGTS